jgi:transporter family-2 protein
LNFTLLIGAFGALLTGMAITIQSTITSRAGAILGDFRTGVLTNFLGGTIAGILVLIFLVREGGQAWKIPGNVLFFIAISGSLGIFIITGISFSLQRAGVAAGLATVILGQLILSVIIDRLGIGGADMIPISGQRILGLIIMALGVFLLLPRE